MTPADLAELKRLSKEATEKPWHFETHKGLSWVSEMSSHAPADSQLICQLRNHADELIAAVERVEELERRMKGLVIACAVPLEALHIYKPGWNCAEVEQAIGEAVKVLRDAAAALRPAESGGEA